MKDKEKKFFSKILELENYVNACKEFEKGDYKT